MWASRNEVENKGKKGKGATRLSEESYSWMGKVF